MDKMLLENYVNEGFTGREIAIRMNCGQTNVRHWLKKYGLKTIRSNKDTKDKICPKCLIKQDISNFYNRRGKTGGSVYCRGCTAIQATSRHKKLKLDCVNYKGGKCEHCNYDKCISALEFHHLDKNKKEFSISHRRSYSFDEDIVKELDKCILLCANCHREEHDRLNIEQINI